MRAATPWVLDTTPPRPTSTSWIDLLTAGGTSIANNDTGFSGDPGGFGNDDAMITFNVTTTGTYYVKVGQWTVANPPSSLPLTAGQTYTLNVSLTSGQALFDPPTSGDSDLNGGVGDDFLVAGLGDDDIAGGDDNDTLSYQTAIAGVIVSLAAQGAAQDTATAGMDNISGVENLIGSGFNDMLTGAGAPT